MKLKRNRTWLYMVPELEQMLRRLAGADRLTVGQLVEKLVEQEQKRRERIDSQSGIYSPRPETPKQNQK